MKMKIVDIIQIMVINHKNTNKREGSSYQLTAERLQAHLKEETKIQDFSTSIRRRHLQTCHVGGTAVTGCVRATIKRSGGN